jgi:3-oxoacyl-[acyl-carrier-protein] synthase III
MAGGGMRTGQVIGATDRLGGEATERPVMFGEVFATLYQRLGIDVTKTTLDDAGVTLDEIDGLVTAFSFVESTLMHSTTFADYLGWAPGYFSSVAVGGATAPLMAVQAMHAIDAGLAEAVLCVRGDNTRSGISSSGMMAMAREMSHGAF